MIWVHYIESAGFEKEKKSDKQIIHHKSTKHIPYISITGFTSLLSNKKHTHSIPPGILTTTKVLNYWGYLIICKTTEFRDSIPGIMNYFHEMVNNIHQKRIWRPWNQCGSLCLHLRRRIWNSRTSGASRHRDTRELPLEQRPNLHEAGDPIEKHTDLLKHGYIIVL